MTHINPLCLAHQRQRFMRPDAHRFVRPDWRRFARADSELASYYESIERKYRPDQARVPAGSREGGQWTDEGGGETTTFSAASKKTSLGHHFAAKKTYRNLPLRPETRQVLDDATTGKLNDPSSNLYDKAHRRYNDAVADELDKFLSENDIQPEDMTPDQARAFVKRLKESSDPRIRAFNMRMRLREIIFRFQRALRRGE